MSSAESPSPLKRTSTVVTIVATVIGTVVAYLSLAAAVKWPPFEKTEQVEVFRGQSAQGEGNCADPSCAFVGVRLAGFEAGSTVRCVFESSAQVEDAFLPYVAVVDGEGGHTGQTLNFFGNPGGWISATCGETTGVVNPW